MVHQVVSSDEFRNKIKTGVVIVDFYATWCGPCKAISPFLENLSKNNPSISFIKVDVDELEDIAEEFQVTGMPTFHLYVEGEKRDEIIGANKSKLEEWVKNF